MRCDLWNFKFRKTQLLIFCKLNPLMFSIRISYINRSTNCLKRWRLEYPLSLFLSLVVSLNCHPINKCHNFLNKSTITNDNFLGILKLMLNAIYNDMHRHSIFERMIKSINTCWLTTNFILSCCKIKLVVLFYCFPGQSFFIWLYIFVN